jgi:hypothetical protein
MPIVHQSVSVSAKLITVAKPTGSATEAGSSRMKLTTES